MEDNKEMKNDHVKIINPALRKLKCIECNYGPLRYIWSHGAGAYHGDNRVLKFLNRFWAPNGEWDEYICDNCYLSHGRYPNGEMFTFYD